MEIEFQGILWTLTSDDEYANPRGSVARLTQEAVSEAKKAHEGRHLDCVNWTHTASWLLGRFWLAASDQQPAREPGA
ncbi:hypothetical protein N7U49_22840 [Streptomyces sp. AD2-2]|nr:hypothetical protein N7U49_22840 [Streptomyces sp. AD2-2]